jgi:soluble lytic murein transglycosylase
MSKGKQKNKVRGALIALIIMAAAVALFVAVVFFDLRPGVSRYPLEYAELIEEYSAEYGLDPYFVSAVIHTESGFDPQAASGVGALGLMQIMPETGEWIAGKLGVEDYSKQMLYDPETNIRFGCWYLGFLSERFGSNLQLVMAGYNAGHNRVAEWVGDPNISDGESLVNIPFKETDDYIKKVERALEKYREQYPRAF